MSLSDNSVRNRNLARGFAAAAISGMLAEGATRAAEQNEPRPQQEGNLIEHLREKGVLDADAIKLLAEFKQFAFTLGVATASAHLSGLGADFNQMADQNLHGGKKNPTMHERKQAVRFSETALVLNAQAREILSLPMTDKSSPLQRLVEREKR